ncbi:T9SS type A sorting domain-containing protein [Chitinophaga sp. SYP-B3965]|uniref:FISUMP domain-containing protein n=1 Tax=Chitinophaga sp. SYP-B3965 TaxID=2663120 RepID=UPI001299DF1B|nr:FISUMP domain-containing protein [Chitinophaga sp. SYP-B3965]MRG45854.1 T9SS type A sorting domain-containing protein [Chitinophaga sp. SYP-B3965]
MPNFNLLRHKFFFLLLFFFTHAAWAQTPPPKPILQWPLDQAKGHDDFSLGLKFKSAGGSNIVYDVYLGPDADHLRVFAENAGADFYNDSCIVFMAADTFYVMAFYPPVQLSTIYWKVVAKDGSGGATASDVWSFTMGRANLFEPEAPVLSAPANNGVNLSRSPLLEWTASTDQDGDMLVYDIYLSTGTIPANYPPIATGITGTSFQVTTPITGNTTYYWNVIARDPGGLFTNSSIWKFTTRNTPPPVVIQSLPEHQAVGVDYNATLSWEKAVDEDRDSVRYELWYGIGAALDKMQAVNGFSKTLNLSGNTTYSWKVVAVDSRGDRSESSVRTFITQNNPGNAAPAAPQLQSPLNNNTGITFQQTLQWNAATDPDNDGVKYTVYMGTAVTALTAVATDLTNTTFLPTVLSGKTYYWKVAAYDSKGGVTESSIWQFATITDDMGLSNLRFYYRFSDPQLYRYDLATLSPAFDVSTSTYTTKGKTTVKDAVGIVLDYSDPSTVVTFDIPSYLTLTEGITYNYGLPVGATKYYMISGTLAADNIITVHLQKGAAKRSYTINARLNQKPAKPVALEPAINAANVSVTPELKWTGGDDPEGGNMLYRVSLGTSSAALSPRGIINKKSMPVTGLMGLQRYYWKVTAIDDSGEQTDSDIFTFVTEKVTKVANPTLEYPREISVYVATDVTLAWRYMDDPGITYDVYLDTKAQPDRIAQGITGKTYTALGLLPNTTYYWKVVAIDQQGVAKSTVVRKFLTKPLNSNETGTFTDIRDGQIYQWVRINGEKWMTHNLSYLPEPRDGYYGYEPWNELDRDKNFAALDNNDQNISKYGYLYTWAAALNFDALPDTAKKIQGVCPAGWHVADLEDWNKLYPISTNKPAQMHYSTWSFVGKENEWLNTSGLSMLQSGFFNVFANGFDTKANQIWLAQRDRETSDQRGITYGEQQNYYFATNNTVYGGASVRCVKNTPDNHPPAEPVLQSPLNNSQNIPFNGLLQWTAATDPDNGDIVVYDLYIDTINVPAQLIQSGIKETTYQLSELEPNKKYYWKVRARDTSGEVMESAVWAFTTQSNPANTVPPVPQLITPAFQSTSVTITPAAFQWTAVTDADGDAVKYHFYIGNQLANLQLVAKDLSTPAYQVSGLHAGVTYYWKVVVTDGRGGRSESAVGEFATLNRAPDTPLLLTPVNSAQSTALVFDLTWSSVTDPDGDKVYYKLMFGTSPSTLGIWNSDFNATRYAIPWAYLQTGTVYYWKVVATDEKGGESASEMRSFRTYGTFNTNGSPTLVSPLNWSIDVNTNPLLTWRKTMFNHKYDLYVGGDPLGMSLVANDLTDSSFTITQLYGASKLKPHSIYFWKVMAKDGPWSVWESPAWRFTTANTAPSKPILTNPSAANSTLSWTAATDPDKDILTYDVYFGTDPDPVTKIAVDLQLLQYTTASLAPGTYYWKVIVKDAYGGAVSSDVASFTVQPPTQNTPPSAPQLLTPADQSKAAATLPVVFRWAAAADPENGPVTYELYLSDVKVAEGLTTLSYTHNNLTAGTYSWKVIAKDDHGNTTASAVRSITTVNAFVISGKVVYATGRGLPDILLSALVRTDGNGIYSVSVPPGWSGIFKPVFWSYEFEPKEIVYTNVQSDFSAQDYVVKVITAVNDPELDSLVKVHPNPTSGPVEIILPVSLQAWQLEIHDIKGVLVHAQKIAGNTGKLRVQIPGKGVFLLRLSNQKKTIVRKIIVL